MPRRFGETLRKLRRKSNKTLGDVADAIGVSVPYLSDVERGNRRPFNVDRIVQIAVFCNENPTELITAADAERGVIEYDIRNATPLEADVVGGLVAGLARGGLDSEKLEKIQKIIREGN
jgi:transcriptional regulator with XRE-family HTH domain